MKYIFKCPQCKESEEVEMSIKEYAKYDPVCERCKVKKERVYEMPQFSGKDSESDGDFDPPSTCGGSCASCGSCGI